MIPESNRRQVIGDVHHAMIEFQIGDLEKSAKDGLNFLTAIGLMVSTEFLGGLITGNLGLSRHSGTNFEAGFMRLGEQYSSLFVHHREGVLNIYKNVRCGFIHQYLPNNVMGVLTQETFGPGIAEIGGQFAIFVSDYVRDLKKTVENLLKELEGDNALFFNCQKALNQIPKLL